MTEVENETTEAEPHIAQSTLEAIKQNTPAIAGVHEIAEAYLGAGHQFANVLENTQLWLCIRSLAAELISRPKWSDTVKGDGEERFDDLLKRVSAWDAEDGSKLQELLDECFEAIVALRGELKQTREVMLNAVAKQQGGAS